MKKLGLFWILIAQLVFTAYGQEQKVVSVSRYIAVSLFNFSKQVNWPASCQTGDFVVAIIGDKSVYQEFQTISAGKTIGSQSIHVQYFKNPEEVTGFNHVIYLNEWYSSSISKVILKIGNQNTLIVGEKEGLVRNGAAISFTATAEGVMKFELEKRNVEKYGLQVSAWLEKMAMKTN
jgi:hypothetical protein